MRGLSSVLYTISRVKYTVRLEIIKPNLFLSTVGMKYSMVEAWIYSHARSRSF